MSSLLLRRLATAGAAVVAFGAFGALPAAAQTSDDFDVSIAPVTVSGAIGDTVTVNLVVSSNGPQDVEHLRTAFIQQPKDTQFTGVVSPECDGTVQPGRYYCTSPDPLPVGAKKTWTFHLKITGTDQSGGILFFADGGGEDRIPDNDLGAFTINVVESTPVASPTPSATRPATASTGAAPRATTSPVAGAALPVTGDRTALYAGLGALLVVGGVVLFVLARRRRVVMVTPSE
jgi:LPXTG-motif cell wall-anchored protein